MISAKYFLYKEKNRMKNFIISIFLLSVYNYCDAQKKTFYIEISPFLKYDKYDEFVGWATVLGGEHYVKLKGLSFGLNANVKKQTFNNYAIFLGAGYYRYSFTEINSRSNLGTANGRRINFPSPLLIPFYTDEYYYNTLSLNLGVEKIIDFNKNLQLIAGIEVINYFTFSQYYHLSYNSEGNQDYRKKNMQYFGNTSNMEIGLLKKLSRIRIGPKLQVPIFISWKTDETFPTETNTGNRNKWLNGVGLSISCNYYLTQKH